MATSGFPFAAGGRSNGVEFILLERVLRANAVRLNRFPFAARGRSNGERLASVVNDDVEFCGIRVIDEG